MLHARNRILMRASADVVYQLAAEIERWPVLLEHYRYVKILEDLERSRTKQSRVVKMSAFRTSIPTVWTSIQETYPERHEVRYRWIKGAARDMDVVWRIEPAADGVQVTIDHDLARPRWWLRNPLALSILGHVFIEHIAGKTLAGIKRHAEARMALAEGQEPGLST
ncbi:MAG: SRPBCC family protein [Chloroflexi bacterium]|nr:SRPBCC family protein [Chloroflexota bacterium]